MRHFLLLLSLLGLSAGTAGAQTQRHTVNTGEFSKLHIDNNINVIYTSNPDSIGMAWFTGDDKYADSFYFTNKKGTLHVQADSDVYTAEQLPTVYVSSDFLVEVESQSNATVRIEKPSSGPDFKAVLIGNGRLIVTDLKCSEVLGKLSTGNGSVVLSGSCSTAKLNMMGTGIVQADNLEANSVICKFIGTGAIGCHATKELRAKGMGSTKIYYKGNPSSIKRIGGGKLIELNSVDASTWEEAAPRQ